MTELSRELDVLVPPFDNSDADWNDVVRRSGGRAKWPVALVAAAVAAGVLAAASLGTALGTDALDRLSAWVSGAPGEPAPNEEVEALRAENAKSLAPIPDETELGLLTTKSLDGQRFQLLGFRDRGSLCLRLRMPSGTQSAIVKAPASCLSEELLVALGKPLAVVAAADPFPQRARRGVLALYGFAADGVAAVELVGESARRRVAVENNSFLLLYPGESPRLTNGRLDYRADVPLRAIALDSAGRVLARVPITSLRRGSPGAPSANALPGPTVAERPITDARVSWLDVGPPRGEPYAWPEGGFQRLRILQPSAATSLRVVVGRVEDTYWLTNVWPLQQRPTGMLGVPVGRPQGALGTAQAMFDAQFPVHYGLVPDGVASLELFLANGEHRAVPLLHNVFVVQTWSAEPAKLVGYDADGRVALIRVLAY